jgi:nicotinate-nucleotide adenylyltransferase
VILLPSIRCADVVTLPRQQQAGPAIGILGGTFDPVHNGHLRAAVEAREKLGLGELRLLPAGDPPHRPKPLASAGQRLEMLRLATRSCDGLAVDDREVRRAGPSFMVDTLTEIRSEAGGAPLFLLIGQDAANALDGWHRWQELFGLAHLVVMRRPDAHFQCAGELRRQIEMRRVEKPGQLHETESGCVLALEITQLDISSTLIRELFARGSSPRFLMPDAVIEYILQGRFYGGG